MDCLLPALEVLALAVGSPFSTLSNSPWENKPWKMLPDGPPERRLDHYIHNWQKSSNPQISINYNYCPLYLQGAGLYMVVNDSSVCIRGPQAPMVRNN